MTVIPLALARHAPLLSALRAQHVLVLRIVEYSNIDSAQIPYHQRCRNALLVTYAVELSIALRHLALGSPVSL